jgi:hypothetical protein
MIGFFKIKALFKTIIYRNHLLNTKLLIAYDLIQQFHELQQGN